MEKFGGAVFFAGLGCFLLSWVIMGWLPNAHLSRLKYQTMDDIAPEPSYEFKELAARYPEQYKKYFGDKVDAAAFHDALKTGKAAYIAEGCWHCHSQFVRPVSNENIRFGKVSYASEYMNEMNLPHLLGTRRVGPDLIREAGKHGNDWHIAHFYKPSLVVPVSVMPGYPWFYDGDKPNKDGISIITYVQWLGSWIKDGKDTLANKDAANE